MRGPWLFMGLALAGCARPTAPAGYFSACGPSDTAMGDSASAGPCADGLICWDGGPASAYCTLTCRHDRDCPAESTGEATYCNTAYGVCDTPLHAM